MKLLIVPSLRNRYIKGQVVFESKLSSCKFLPKTNKWICFYYYAMCFCSFFGGNWRHQKKHFEINWPLVLMSSKYSVYGSVCNSICKIKNSYFLPGRRDRSRPIGSIYGIFFHRDLWIYPHRDVLHQYRFFSRKH